MVVCCRRQLEAGSTVLNVHDCESWGSWQQFVLYQRIVLQSSVRKWTIEIGAAGFLFHHHKMRQGPVWLFHPEGTECYPQLLFHDFRCGKTSIHASPNTLGLQIGCNCSLFQLVFCIYDYGMHALLYILKAIAHAQQACYYMNGSLISFYVALRSISIPCVT